MENRRSDHQLVAEAPMTMRCYSLLTLQFMTIVVIISINSYTILSSTSCISSFDPLLRTHMSERMSQRECKMLSDRCL